jgi:HEAT repeat protein
LSQLAEIALSIAVAFAGMVVLLLAYLGVRRLVTVVLMQRLSRRVGHIDGILQQHQQERFQSLDRMLFQLGEVQDLPAVEAALNRVLPASGEERARLLQVYRSLGIIDRYLKDLREATSRAVRTSAAHALGDLQVLEAIPALVAAMRDPDEDAQTVKLAAAQALGLMRSQEGIPLLLAELRSRDNWASPRIADLLVSFGDAAVPALVTALGDEANTNVRAWAAQTLGRIRAVAAEAPLLQRLRDRSEAVRMSAAEALGNLALRSSVDELMYVALHDPVAPVRAEAARALGRLGDPAALDSLFALLADPDYWTRMRVIGAIELIRPQDTSRLEALLHDPSPEVRNRAAVALDRVGVLAARVEDLASPDRIRRDRATRLLLDVGRAGLLQSLMAYLEHDDLRIRSRMAELLGSLDNLAVVPALAARLGDSEWPVRVRALEALARLRPPDGPARVLPALSDPEEAVRAAAVQALKEFGVGREDEVVEAVARLFDSPNVEVRAGVVEAVAHLAHAATQDLLDRALSDPHADVRLRAVKAAGLRADEAWLPRVCEHLGDPDGPIRVAAIVALGRIGTPQAVEALLPHLDSPDRAVREVLTDELAGQETAVARWLQGMAAGKDALVAQAWLLGKTGDPAVLPELCALARSPHFEVRASAAGALGKLDHTMSREVLVSLLDDRNARVRAAAVNALGRVGREAAVSLLEGVLADPDPFVRNRVAIALGRIGSPDAEAALDRARARDDAPDFQDFVLVGLGLCGGPRAFSLAVGALSDPGRQARLQTLLDGEAPEVRKQFLQVLDPGNSDGMGLFLTADEVAAHCAAILRSHGAPEARAAAVASLRSLQTPAARDLLIDAVTTDPAAEVRARALEVLVELPPDDGLARLFTRALRDPVVAVQVQAARGLAKAGAPVGNVELLRAFHIDDTALRETLVDTLARLNAGNVAAFLDDLMGFPDETVLRCGLQVVGRLRDPASAGLLMAWLSDRNPVLRAAAAQALGHVATAESAGALARSLSDPVEDVRRAAVESLGALGALAADGALQAASQDPSPWVRKALARAMATRSDGAAMNLLDRLATDPDDEVRVEALLGFASAADVSRLATFRARVEAQPRAVRARLVETPDSHAARAALVQRAAEAREAPARAAALEALAVLGRCPESTLVNAFRDPAPEVRARAAALVPADASAECRAALRRLSQDPVESVRNAVTAHIGPALAGQEEWR